MKEAINYFLAADTIGMSPFKWAMTFIFSVFLLLTIYLTWKRGFRNIDILNILLIMIILFRSGFAIVLQSESPNQVLRLLFFLFPVGMTLVIHYIFSTYKKLRIEQLAIGFVVVFLVIINLTFGGALVPGSPHWWADIYPLKTLNRIWLLAAGAYSSMAIWRMREEQQPFRRFIRAINAGLVVYLGGHFLLTISTTMEMYWIYRYHGFVSDLIIVYAFTYLVWSLLRRPHSRLDEEAWRSQIDIFAVMGKVPADKLMHYLHLHHPDSIPGKIEELTPRQQLQAMLMIHKVSIKESAEYSHITPQAVKVYRSRIRNKIV